MADRDGPGDGLPPRRRTRSGRLMRGRPLAVRLAILLAGVLVVVLVLAGVVVNRAASRSLDQTLGPREQQRLNLAATIIEQGMERGIDGRGMQALLGRIAAETRGMVRVVADDGSVAFEAGRLRPGTETDTLSTELSSSAGGGA